MAKHEVEHIRIEPAEGGGAISHVHRKEGSGRGKNAGPWLQDDRVEHYAHKSAEEAGAHVTAVLKKHHGGVGKNSEQGAELETPGPKVGKKQQNIGEGLERGEVTGASYGK